MLAPAAPELCAPHRFRANRQLGDTRPAGQFIAHRCATAAGRSRELRDYRHAITYARTLPEVDPGHIGIWGSGYSGGHVLVVAAIDRRVKAVVSQVPLVSGHDNLRALVRADFIAGFREQLDADRLARFRGEPPAMVPVVDKDPLAPSALPTRDSWECFTETGNTRAPAWRNEVTLRSVEMFTEYEPERHPAIWPPVVCQEEAR
jgi:uncharacterized protein